MEKPRRGKDGNFCKLFKSSDKNNNRITQSRNRLIEIIKLGHESNHHLMDGRHQNRPLVQKHLTRNKAIPFRGSTLAIGKGSKSSQSHDGGRRKVRVPWAESCSTTIDHICIVPKKGGGELEPLWPGARWHE